MAIRYAVATGNWSNVAIWNGGASVPTTGDYVYANGYTVTLDTDVNIGSGTLSTEVCLTTGIGGGSFTNTAIANLIIISSIKAGTTTCLTTSRKTQVIGNIYGSDITDGAVGWYNNTTAAGQLLFDIIGNVYGGNGGTTSYGLNARADRSFSFSVTGNIYGGLAYGIYIYTTTTGFVTNGSVSAGIAPAIYVRAMNAGQSAYINGNILASPTSSGISSGDAFFDNIFVSGSLFNNSGVPAIRVINKVFISNTSQCTVQNIVGADIILLPSTTLENPPAESDVRAGVAYGIGDAYEGTLEVGASPAEFVAALEASNLGVRMSKCAITEEVLTMLGNLE